MRLIIIMALITSGCTTMTKEQIGNLALQALAARVANGPRYNYQQQMANDQQSWNAFMANHLEQQRQLKANDNIFAPGGLGNPINVRVVK